MSRLQEQYKKENQIEKIKDLTGMSLSNPNPFYKRLENRDPKLFKTIIKDGFYDIDTLKEKYGLKTETEWDEALNEIGDEDIYKIKKLIRSGENLDSNPRISISTIHGVKSNERENVVVITDLVTNKEQ